MGLLASTVIQTHATGKAWERGYMCTCNCTEGLHFSAFHSIQQLFYSALLSNNCSIQLYSALVLFRSIQQLFYSALFSSIQQLFYSALFSNCSIQLYSAIVLFRSIQQLFHWAIVLFSYWSIQQNDDSGTMSYYDLLLPATYIQVLSMLWVHVADCVHVCLSFYQLILILIYKLALYNLSVVHMHCTLWYD